MPTKGNGQRSARFWSFFSYSFFLLFLECTFRTLLCIFFFFLQTDNFHLLAPAMERQQSNGGSCKAPCLRDAEPPEVRLKLLFPVLSSLIQTDFYPCNGKRRRLFTSFLLFLGDCILPEYFLALCVIHKGLWCCLMVFGSWWNCHNRFEDFADNQPGITLPFHPITHIILVTSQV